MYAALTAGSFGGDKAYEMVSPPPVGSFANVLPAALALRSVWICVASVPSIVVISAFQLATSVALALVVVDALVPSVDGLGLVTVIA